MTVTAPLCRKPSLCAAAGARYHAATCWALPPRGRSVQDRLLSAGSCIEMAENPEKTPLNDDALLADAIPIDNIEDVEDDAEELAPIDLTSEDEQVHREIKMLGARKAHQAAWKRQPNATGTGAIHCKTFVSKLRMDAIEFLDTQINQWLDNNPEYEVKFVTTNIGDLRGKSVEPALFVTVWV
jgi:hypothetical protein